MRPVFLFLAVSSFLMPLMASPLTAQSGQRRDVLEALEAQTRGILAEMIAANTTAEDGATTPLVESVAARFRAAGFPATDVIVAGPNDRNGNLIVRWRGTTSAKPFLLNAHLDVVEAAGSGWETDPFSLTERDGYLYGRGVLDDKGPASAAVAAMIALKSQGVIPKRDIVLALTAGEETDIDNGVQWLLANRRDLVDAGYVLNLDAGGATFQNDSVRSFRLQVAEKIYLDLELRAVGDGGHSSIPHGINPVHSLARAMDRIAAFEFPVSVGPLMQEYFRKTAPLRTGAMAGAMATLGRTPGDVEAQRVVLQDPLLRAQLRTTCVVTVVRAGNAPNAIPSEAVATVNCRLLPGTDEAAIVGKLKEVIDDSTVSISVVSPAVPSDVSTPDPTFIGLLERVVSADFGVVPIIPYMETGATDALWFRNAGIPAFGVAGLFLDSGDYERAHGLNERMSLRSFSYLVSYTDRLLRELAAQ